MISWKSKSWTSNRSLQCKRLIIICRLQNVKEPELIQPLTNQLTPQSTYLFTDSYFWRRWTQSYAFRSKVRLACCPRTLPHTDCRGHSHVCFVNLTALILGLILLHLFVFLKFDIFMVLSLMLGLCRPLPLNSTQDIVKLWSLTVWDVFHMYLPVPARVRASHSLNSAAALLFSECDTRHNQWCHVWEGITYYATVPLVSFEINLTCNILHLSVIEIHK